ncbi:hypothetical protein EST38_g14320 [Candolleomyces aberdarensis]|uniref:Uncharacterized protein n=1 Tax=Candolleomyces aberdarensis TaxID=2316362 RepID=A0A4Q2D091_9AGAR|nr:hypothetical protein EST38_g14320 [Candolleomyces aberdarensis]
MGGGKSKRLNAPLRKNASAALFPILHDLGLQAALTHKGAFALYKTTQTAPKEIKVVVKLEGELTVEGLCAAVISRTSDSGDHFVKTKKQHSRLNFFSADPQTEGKSCRVIFIPSGGSFPAILKNFNEIAYISEVPVLPVHAILLEQMITRSRLTAAQVKPPGKGAARFTLKCLLASGGTSLHQLSPLWQSPEILTQVALHVHTLPDAKKHWIAHGIDPSIFTLPSAQQTPGEGTRDSDDDYDGCSDSNDKECPPAVVQAPNVAIQGPDHVGHSALTDAVKEDWITSGNDPSISIHPPSQPGPGEDANDVGNDEDDCPDCPPTAVPAPDISYEIVHTALTDVAARHVVSILMRGFGLECVLSGKAVYQLYSYGTTRVPEELQVLVLPPASIPLSEAWLTQQIAQRYPDLFKQKVKKRTLFYKFPPGIDLPRPFKAARTCRVEILLPGTLGLPHLSASDVVWIDNLPVIPFLASLLLKLETWAGEPKYANTQDVQYLLSLVPNLPVWVVRPWRERKLMSDEFQAKSELRVKKFCLDFQDFKPIWQMLGFEVEDVI